MAQANYDLAVADTLVAITEVDAALASLSEISGVRVNAFDPENQLVTTNQQRSLEYWQTQAQEANYGIKAARMASRVALKALDADAYANSPIIDAKLVINKQIYRGGSSLTPGASTRSVVISLNMPLYQGGRVAAQKQYSKDRYNVALQQQQKLEQELTSRVTAQYLQEQAMHKRIEAITKALESTVKATHTIRTGLGYGVSTQAQLLASTKQEFQLQLQLKQAKYQATLSNMQLRQMEVEGTKGREKEKEDRKDKRTKIQATQQSEMIDQRNNQKPPKNFESASNDILGGGFDLGSFDPS
jgi:outer membrane protein